MQTRNLKATDKVAQPMPCIGVPDIAFDMVTLPNGLKLVVHEDRSTPRVAMQLSYGVGSKEEPKGFTGFAHLFEHLMFGSSANRSGRWHDALGPLGATNINGSTGQDRTNFYQTVPKAVLDRALWMEADRMGFVLQGLDAKGLAEEILVVKNEKRQLSQGPYSDSKALLERELYPTEHPYAHPVLGLEEDLDQASLEKAAFWHRRWYGAANAVLTLVGDIDIEEAREKVAHWFRGLPSGEPTHHQVAWIPEARGLRRFECGEKVPYPIHWATWLTPGAKEIDATLLGFAATIIGAGPQSRLVRRLVDEEQLCLDIVAVQASMALCGLFQIAATLQPHADLDKVEAIVHEELARFIEQGPTQRELDQLRQASQDNYAEMLENIEFKSEILAHNTLMFGQPDGGRYLQEASYAASCEEVRAAAERWYSRGSQILAVNARPFAAQTAQAPDVDRTLPPLVGEIHAPAFPAIENAKLANGLTIKLVRRASGVKAEGALVLDGGTGSDPEGLEGLTGLTVGVMGKETTERTQEQLIDHLLERSIGMGTALGGEYFALNMSAEPSRLGEAMKLTAESLLNPAFKAEEFDQPKAQTLAALQHQIFPPAALADRIATKLALGFVREASPASIEAIDRDIMLRRHQAWLDPQRATLVVVGDMTIDQVVSAAEQAFGTWAPSGAVLPAAPDEPYYCTPGRYAAACPGEPQTSLKIMLKSDDLKNATHEAADIFFGCLSNRLRQSLRGKGWTYGVACQPHIEPKLGFFQITTSVQADRSLDAVTEIERELRALSGDQPFSQEEFDAVFAARVSGLVNSWPNNEAVMNTVISQIVRKLPDDDAAKHEARLRAVSMETMREMASWLGDLSQYVWVAAGDPKWLSDGSFTFVDSEGAPV